MTPRPALLLTVTLLTATALAQGRGPGGGNRGPMGSPPGSRGEPSPNQTSRTANRANTPTGRWWDDSQFARSLGIDGKQQRRLDTVFEDNRPVLVQLYQNLQAQQSQLNTLRVHSPDETQLFQQIDRVTQARGDLQKAYAHLLLQLRKELTPAQAAKLDELHPS